MHKQNRIHLKSLYTLAFTQYSLEISDLYNKIEIFGLMKAVSGLVVNFCMYSNAPSHQKCFEEGNLEVKSTVSCDESY